MLGSASSSSYEPYTWGIPNCAAAALPFSRLRDAMALNSMYLPFCMAGITLPVPILAVLRTPQRTLFMTRFLSGTQYFIRAKNALLQAELSLYHPEEHFYL